MQASLKINTHNTEYLLLTISNIEDNSPPEQSQPNSNNYLNDSNITHSRVTEHRYPLAQQDRVNESRDSEEEGSVGECATCAVWKRWAMQQEREMLMLEERISARQMLLQQNIASLTQALTQKNQAIEQYSNQLAASKERIAGLAEQISIKQKERESQNASYSKTNASPSQPTTYTTPLKTESNSQRMQGDRCVLSTKMSQMLTDQKKGRTCTTGKQLQWSAFQTNLKQNEYKLRHDTLQKYQFQNTMLKQYNAVLLQRLKESKYRQ